MILEASIIGGGPTTRVRLIPENGTAVNVGLIQGRSLGAPWLDAESVYWMERNAGQLTAWASPRMPGDSISLGTLPLADASEAQGLVSIGTWLYAAINTTGGGQVVRASKDGHSQLAAFGPALPPVAALTSDGTDLLLMLQGTTDRLGNPAAPPRIARMLSSGTLSDVTAIETVGSDLAVNAGRIYWRVNDNTGSVWTAALWSAPLDGSTAPAKLFTTPGNLLSYGLGSDQDSLYFSIYCRVDMGNRVSGRTHILRFSP